MTEFAKRIFGQIFLKQTAKIVIYKYNVFDGGILLEKYKHFIDMIKIYLGDDTLELDEKVLDELIEGELDKPTNKMDTYLIDLCLDALVAHRESEKIQKENAREERKSV